MQPLLQPIARAALALKAQLEKVHTMTKPDLMMQTFIDCTHDALWDALTKGEPISQYHFGCEKVEADRDKPGDQIDMYFPARNGRRRYAV